MHADARHAFVGSAVGVAVGVLNGVCVADAVTDGVAPIDNDAVGDGGSTDAHASLAQFVQ